MFLLLNEELANSLHTLINFINHYYLRMHHLLEKSFKERHLLYIRPTAVIHDFIKNKTKIKFFVKKPLFLLYIYQTIIYLTFTKSYFICHKITFLGTYLSKNKGSVLRNEYLAND